jgi:hypothetical protein
VGNIAIESMKAVSGAGPYKSLIDGWLASWLLAHAGP